MLRIAVTFLIYLWAVLPVLQGAPIDQDDPLHILPLRRISLVRDGEHPIMAFQRHQNAAVKRLHTFVGAELPDEALFQERTLSRLQSAQLNGRTWFLPNETVIPLWIPTKRQNAPPAATTTITAGGSNAGGFPPEAMAALTGLSLTNSTSDLVEGGLPYIIEFNDIGYLIEVPIGTPPQTFLLLADTGSGDTWVPSSCGDHTSLGAEVTYGSGAVAGQLCADTMEIAGMTLEDHVFGVTTQESIQFSGAKVPFDGLMGLSFNALSTQRAMTPIDALQQKGLIKDAVLGIALGRIADGENNGELAFGQVNKAKLDPGTTQILPVSSTRGFWQVDMGDVNVNGEVVATARQAILDTGTSLMVAPEPDCAQAFHAQIKGARMAGNGMFSIPCTTDAVITMTFGFAAFQIDVRDMLFQPLTDDPEGQCISALSAGTVVDAQTWLLGDSFLKNVYMSTDVQKRTVYLSARTDSPLSSSFKTPPSSVETSSTSTSANSTLIDGTSTGKNDTGGQALNAQTGSASIHSDFERRILILSLSGLVFAHLWYL